MTKSKKGYHYVHRSSITGEFVTKEFAELNKGVTFRQKIWHKLKDN